MSKSKLNEVKRLQELAGVSQLKEEPGYSSDIKQTWSEESIIMRDLLSFLSDLEDTNGEEASREAAEYIISICEQWLSTRANDEFSNEGSTDQARWGILNTVTKRWVKSFIDRTSCTWTHDPNKAWSIDSEQEAQETLDGMKSMAKLNGSKWPAISKVSSLDI
jgi:hypothetical protein